MLKRRRTSQAFRLGRPRPKTRSWWIRLCRRRGLVIGCRTGALHQQPQVQSPGLVLAMAAGHSNGGSTIGRLTAARGQTDKSAMIDIKYGVTRSMFVEPRTVAPRWECLGSDWL